MKLFATILLAAVVVLGIGVSPMNHQTVVPMYKGSTSCTQGCHAGDAETAEWKKMGHKFALNPVAGAAPVYPANSAPNIVTPPAGTAWGDFSYVMGGYGWKALLVTTANKFYTAGNDAQFNVADGSTQPFHMGEDLDFGFACFQCHTTGPVENPASFVEAGVACEACHGPSSDHTDGGGAFQNPPILPPNQGAALQQRCYDCHQNNAGASISAAGGFIVSSGQFDEFKASKHGKTGWMTCTTCHDPHVATHWPDASATVGILQTCESCHADHDVKLNDVSKGITCETCHMSQASVNAVGVAMGNAWKGDVKTHIFGINAASETKDAMFSPDGSSVVVDGAGLAAVTLDFACLQCHTDKDVAWASYESITVHTTGLHSDHTATEDLTDLPSSFELLQNYPNPFNPTTTVRFDLPATAAVTLEVFSVDGRLVEKMLDQTMPAGKHQIDLNLAQLPSGNYIYRLNAGTFTASKTMTLLK